MDTLEGLPIVLESSQASWAAWLDSHHAASQGIWLKIAKKNASMSTVSYSDALEEALCYGWIDGQKKPFDDEFWLQKFTPRRPKSGWSKVNTEKATQLIAAGRMKPAGLEQINAAKADGRWDAAYDSQRTMTIPEDFAAELEKNSTAQAFFETLNKQNRYAICYRIGTAKKAETRRARIDKFVTMLSNGEKLYP